ncbi:MAG: toxin RelE [Candidatus Eremiobacteraeota bacterium]|nr:toxin RelE [Candidatus Eremiobacteraeota bacterium]
MCHTNVAGEKELVWISTSYKDLIAMPDEVQDAIGYALDLAQRGAQADYAQQMKGRLRDVIEVRSSDDTGNSTFRAAYTVTLGDIVYVLDAFQKKSKKGIETPKVDLDRIEGRLKQAKDHHEKQQRKV